MENIEKVKRDIEFYENRIADCLYQIEILKVFLEKLEKENIK